jgi:hypothetical protein
VSFSKSVLVRLFGIGVLASLAFAQVSQAQSFSSDHAVEQLLPAPDQTGFAGFPSTRTPGPWGLDGTLWLGYGYRTMAVDLPGPDIDAVRHRLDATLIGQVGIGGRGALALRLPGLLTQSDHVPTTFPTSQLATQAVGNPAIEGRVRVLGAPVRSDGSVDDGTAIALRGLLHVPVGTSDALFAERDWRSELAAIVDLEAFGLGAGAQLSWRHAFASRGGYGPESQDQLRLAAGFKVPLPLVAKLRPGQVQESALVEIDVGIAPKEPFESGFTPVEGRLSYRISIGDVTLSIGAGGAFTDAAGAADARAWLGASYSPRKHDQDADGVPDADDQCEHLAEDRDGFEDADGCPEPDNDQDMILDEDDRCPLEPAEIDRDEDEDGCTDP